MDFGVVDGSAGGFMIALRAVAHPINVRRVAWVCVFVVAMMSTAIPMLLAQDSAGPFSPATLAEMLGMPLLELSSPNR